MEVYALSRKMAEKRVPEKPELLIGILNSRPHDFDSNHVRLVLPSNELRVDYLIYTFDDIDEKMKGLVLINRYRAVRMLEDFSKFRSRIESLAVHCRVGIGRSTAVAAALNDCFSLGSDSDEFFGGGYQTNRLVYNLVCRTAKEIGICEEEFIRW